MASEMQLEPPICADCAHLVGRRTHHEQATNWKCAHHENITGITLDLVTGFSVYHYLHSSCYAARGNGPPEARANPMKVESCGPEGKWFLKYEHVPHNPSGLNLGGRKQTPSAEALLDELEKT